MDGPARVEAGLRERQLQASIERFPTGTATSPDAPAAGRYEAGQIVKTLIFLAQGGQRAYDEHRSHRTAGDG